jgi:hypothetical protein
LGNIKGEARETKGKVQEDRTRQNQVKAILEKETVTQSDKELKQTRHDKKSNVQQQTSQDNLRNTFHRNKTKCKTDEVPGSSPK